MFQNWKDVTQEQVLFVLQQLKELFSDKEKWLDWPEAVDINNIEVGPLAPEAVKWSLMGASFKISSEKYTSPLSNFVDCATREFLTDLSDDETVGKLSSYDDEYALILLGYEFLSKEEK